MTLVHRKQNRVIFLSGQGAELLGNTGGRHNECIAVHGPGYNGGSQFYSCADEPNEANPGSCTEQAICPTLRPDCPNGTVGSITDNGWSGFCIPLDQCEQPL